jgi:hypothetical protein
MRTLAQTDTSPDCRSGVYGGTLRWGWMLRDRLLFGPEYFDVILSTLVGDYSDPLFAFHNGWTGSPPPTSTDEGLSFQRTM